MHIRDVDWLRRLTRDCRHEDDIAVLVCAMLHPTPRIRYQAYLLLWSEMERDDAHGRAILDQMVRVLGNRLPVSDRWLDLLVFLRHLREPGVYERWVMTGELPP
jgi:hypothetical protein